MKFGVNNLKNKNRMLVLCQTKFKIKIKYLINRSNIIFLKYLDQ